MPTYRTVFTVQRIDFAHWRYRIGHPLSGQLARIERYVASELSLLEHAPSGRFRWDDGRWI